MIQFVPSTFPNTLSHSNKSIGSCIYWFCLSPCDKYLESVKQSCSCCVFLGSNHLHSLLKVTWIWIEVFHHDVVYSGKILTEYSYMVIYDPRWLKHLYYLQMRWWIYNKQRQILHRYSGRSYNYFWSCSLNWHFFHFAKSKLWMSFQNSEKPIKSKLTYLLCQLIFRISTFNETLN